MKLGTHLRTLAGLAAFSATLVLSAPGVKVARAGESADAEFQRFLAHANAEQGLVVAPEAAGETCAAGLRPQRESLQDSMQVAIQRLAAQVNAEQDGPPAKLRVLDNRGGNYGEAPVGIDQIKLRMELLTR